MNDIDDVCLLFLRIDLVVLLADAADYTPTTPSTTNVTFMSSGGNEPNARRMCVFVSITEDQQLEGLESFTLELVFALPATNAILSPNVTQIFIEDNEGMYIMMCAFKNGAVRNYNDMEI